MERVEYKITLDLHAMSSPVNLNVNQGETAVRIIAGFAKNGVPYKIADGCYAVFSGKKPDGTVLWNKCSIEGSTVIYDFTAQTVAVQGIMAAQIRLYSAGSQLICSPDFTVIVDANTVTDGEAAEASQSEVTALTELVAECQVLLNTLIEANARPNLEQTDPEANDYVLGSDKMWETLRLLDKNAQETGEAIIALGEAVAVIKAELAYIPITISNFIKNVSSTYEKGTVLDSVDFSWKLNKEPVSQNIAFGGQSVALEVDDRAQAIPGPFDQTVKFVLTAVDEKGAKHTAETSVSFVSRVYYGLLEDGVTIKSDTIQTLSSKVQGSRVVTFDVAPTRPMRIAYAIPVSGYGTPTFKGNNGFGVDMYRLEDPVSVTNALGHTESYYVWLSTYLQTKGSTVVVT